MLFLSLLSLLLHLNATEPAPLYLSTDQGNSLQDFTEGLPADVQIRSVSEHDGSLYLTAFKYGVFVLPAGTDRWEQRGTGLPLDDNFFHPLSLAVKDDLMVMGTFYHGIYVSADGGRVWLQTSPEPYAVGSLIFTEDGLLAGSHEGVWESRDNGVTWASRSEKIRINVVAEHNDRFFIARQNGMGVLQEDGVRWSDMNSEWAILQLISDGDYLYALNYRNEIFRSRDGIFWETPPEGKEAECTSLPEAVWGGFRPELPDGEPAGLAVPTSRGWLIMPQSGC